MPEAYSREFRRDVLRECDAGRGTLEVAEEFGVSESWVRRCKQQRRETGQVEARRTRDRTPTWRAWADWLKELVAAEPGLYVREIRERLQADKNITVAESTITAALKGLGITRKKRR